MIGLILLITSILLYFHTQKRFWSYLIYMNFLCDGFNILNSTIVAPFTNHDLALVYTVFINAVLVLNGKWMIGTNDKYKKWLIYFVLFTLISSIYSYIHYGLSVYEVIQGGRYFYFVLALPIFMQMKESERKSMIKILFRITVATTILYLLQIIFQTSLFPGDELSVDSTVGILRFSNVPIFCMFFLVYTFASPSYFNKKYLNLYRFIFFFCSILSLSRTLMLTTLTSVLLVLYWSGKGRKNIKILLILFMLFIPLGSIIMDRFEKGNTGSDFSAILNGNYRKYEMGEDGTFTYRLAWVYERLDYLIGRPIDEQIFGLGFMSDKIEKSKQLYNFKVNITFYEIGYTAQLRTPDISYGTLIAYLGFAGTVLYLGFLVFLFLYFYKRKNISPLFLTAAVMLATTFITSFSSDTLSNATKLAIFFICACPSPKLKLEP